MKASLSSSSLLLLVEKIPAVLWTTDTGLRFTSLAGAGLAAMKIQPEDYRGAQLHDFFPCPAADATPLAAHRRALGGEASTFDIEMMSRDLQAHVEALRGPEGAIVGVIGVALDNTERRVAERALRLSEQSYRSLIEEAPYGICRSTMSGQLLQVNRAMVEMLGYDSEAELLLRNVRADVFSKPDPYDQFFAQICAQSPCQGFECAWRRQDNHPILVRLGGRSVRDDAGEISYLEILTENVTERKQLEDQLRQAQKMQAIGQLAGGVAHDFNNLMTVVQGHVELGLAQMPSSDPLRRRLEEVQKAAERATTLTRQLLAFSRRQVLQSRVFDLNVVIAGMSPMLARLIGENIELIHVPERKLGRVSADPGQMEQVLMNLVVNARDAMPAGGKITIETHNVHLDEADAREQGMTGSGDYVALTVSDTGQGMDEATQGRIYEPFFTTKKPGEGTGLGLSMVYGVVKQSGGAIGVRSALGRGTTFTIYLPQVAAPIDASEPRLADPVPGGTETLLLAEDERGVRDLISSFLKLLGYKVLVASDGFSARETGRSFPGDLDLLVTDFVMPRAGGRELAEDLRKRFPRLKVLFISGYISDSIVRDSVLQPNSDFLQKPFSMQLLAKKIREILDRPESSGQGSRD